MKRAAIASIALAFAFAACSSPAGTSGASGSPFALSSASPASTSAASPVSSASAGALTSPAASASAGALSSAGASASAGAASSPLATSSAALSSPAASASAGALSSAAPSGATSSTSASQCVSSALSSGQVGASSAVVDVGSLIDKSDAESVIGSLTGTPARVDLPMTGFIISACVYTSSDGSLAVAIGPNNFSKSDFDSLMKLVPNATTLSGVGDSAFALKASPGAGLTGAASIFVLSGNRYFTLQATSRTKTGDDLITSLQQVASKAAKKF